jgi:hypothetical protein
VRPDMGSVMGPDVSSAMSSVTSSIMGPDMGSGTVSHSRSLGVVSSVDG